MRRNLKTIVVGAHDKPFVAKKPQAEFQVFLGTTQHVGKIAGAKGGIVRVRHALCIKETQHPLALPYFRLYALRAFH